MMSMLMLPTPGPWAEHHSAAVGQHHIIGLCEQSGEVDTTKAKDVQAGNIAEGKDHA
jgi:hypothetical protein